MKGQRCILADGIPKKMSESSPKGHRWKKWVERTVLATGVALIYLGYFWINEWLVAHKVKAYVPVLWIDKVIPFSAYWEYVYALILISAFWPLCVVRSQPLFRRVALSYLMLQSIAWVCFVLFPVQTIHRPTHVVADSFINWGVKLNYWLDLPYCCFPSLHVGMAVIAALACWKVDRWIGSIALGVAFLIGASTLFVKQHYFVDVVGGFLIAALAYRVILYPFQTSHLRPEELRYPRMFSLCLPVLYCLGLACAYWAYLSGWQPWKAT